MLFRIFVIFGIFNFHSLAILSNDECYLETNFEKEEGRRAISLVEAPYWSSETYSCGAQEYPSDPIQPSFTRRSLPAEDPEADLDGFSTLAVWRLPADGKGESRILSFLWSTLDCLSGPCISTTPSQSTALGSTPYTSWWRRTKILFQTEIIVAQTWQRQKQQRREGRRQRKQRKQRPEEHGACSFTESLCALSSDPHNGTLAFYGIYKQCLAELTHPGYHSIAQCRAHLSPQKGIPGWTSTRSPRTHRQEFGELVQTVDEGPAFSYNCSGKGTEGPTGGSGSGTGPSPGLVETPPRSYEALGGATGSISKKADTVPGSQNASWTRGGVCQENDPGSELSDCHKRSHGSTFGRPGGDETRGRRRQLQNALMACAAATGITMQPQVEQINIASDEDTPEGQPTKRPKGALAGGGVPS